MAGVLDILGSLLDGGMKKSTAERVEHSLSHEGVGGSGGILSEIFGGTPSAPAPKTIQPRTAAPAAAGPGGSLGDVVSSILGNKGLQNVGGLGALAGAILGGGGKSMKGAIGGGALAMLGSLALQAFRNASRTAKEPMPLDAANKLTAGLRAPDNEQERKHVHSIGDLIVKAMVNAAKADGRVDEAEMKRIVGNLEKDGIAREEREVLLAELRKPMDTDAIVSRVTDPQLGAQVYAASLLAIDLDTDVEKRYMADLAGRLHLDKNVVRSLHTAVGAAA